MTFEGFPEAALDFYDDLEVDNSRPFWEKHKQVYLDSVRAPMVALCEALQPEFGEAKIFRPYRDVRFRADKTPYKTHQGAFIAAGHACGWYVEVSARGVRVGGGFYRAEPERLARFRAHVADDDTGPLLCDVLDRLRRRGWDLGGDTVKTAPRGFSKDHPRIEVLRHRTLVLGRNYGFEPAVIGVPGLTENVRADFRVLRPLVNELAEVLGDPFDPAS